MLSFDRSLPHQVQMALMQGKFSMMSPESRAEEHRKILNELSVSKSLIKGQKMKRKTSKHNGLNRMKREITAMMSWRENYEVERKEKEEADKLDMEIQARVRAHNKAFYENL